MTPGVKSVHLCSPLYVAVGFIVHNIQHSGFCPLICLRTPHKINYLKKWETSRKTFVPFPLLTNMLCFILNPQNSFYESFVKFGSVLTTCDGFHLISGSLGFLITWSFCQDVVFIQETTCSANLILARTTELSFERFFRTVSPVCLQVFLLNDIFKYKCSLINQCALQLVHAVCSITEQWPNAAV